MKKEIAKINELIKTFEKLCADFPEADAYKDILAKLRRNRAELVSKIGRK